MLDVPRCLHSTDLFSTFTFIFILKLEDEFFFFGRDRNDVVGIGYCGQILNLLGLGIGLGLV